MPDGQVRVRATQIGHYGVIRDVGDEFWIDGAKDRSGKIKAFSRTWMELVEPPKPGKPAEEREPVPSSKGRSKNLGL